MMELVKEVETAVLTQLHGAHGLCSLQVQNHIYGCYILLEDIAMSHVTVTGTTVSVEGYSFDYEKGFSEIGLRYGFLMDTSLELTSWLPVYKDAWMHCFATMSTSPDVSVVDQIEDKVNVVVHRSVPPEEGFFLNAVEHGTLTRNWIDKVLRLLRLLRQSQPQPSQQDDSQNTRTESGTEETVEASILSHAHIEKPIDKKKNNSTTRRNKNHHSNLMLRKNYLNRTRRHPHVTQKKTT